MSNRLALFLFYFLEHSFEVIPRLKHVLVLPDDLPDTSSDQWDSGSGSNDDGEEDWDCIDLEEINGPKSKVKSYADVLGRDKRGKKGRKA